MAKKKKAKAKVTKKKIPTFKKGKPKAYVVRPSQNNPAIQWNGFKFGSFAKKIRIPDDLSVKRSIDIKRNKEKKKQPATQTVSLSLYTFEFEVTLTTSLGCNPYSEYKKLLKAIGTYAPLYLNGKKFLCKNMMLKSVDASNFVLGKIGQIFVVTLKLKFEQFERDKQKLRKESITSKKSLRPGVKKKTWKTVKTAVKVKASAADKATVKKSTSVTKAVQKSVK